MTIRPPRRAMQRQGGFVLVIVLTLLVVLAGYLLHAGLLNDSILAIAVVQEILGRPLGPEGRRLVPPVGG